jgi:hypothetical protein
MDEAIEMAAIGAKRTRGRYGQYILPRRRMLRDNRLAVF